MGIRMTNPPVANSKSLGRLSVVLGDDGRVYVCPTRLRSELAKALEDENASDYSLPQYAKEISSLANLSFVDAKDADPRK